jgi:multidrug resistance efflux pump
MKLQDSQDRLGAVRQGPKPWELDVARRNADVAQAAVDVAQAKLAEASKAPDGLAVDSANASVDRARADVENAEQRLIDLQAGPPTDRVAGAQIGMASAQSTLDSAIARLNELNGRPTRAELSDAEARVAAAQAVVTADPGAFDLLVLEKGVEQDRAQVETVQAELVATRLLAPISGVVTTVQARPGDPVSPDAPAFTLAKPGERVVLADLVGDEADRVVVGQPASVSFDGQDTQQLDASIIEIGDPGAGHKVARLQVSWPDQVPAFGRSVQVVVTLRENERAVLVPQKAIRSAGARRYVELLDGSERRTADIEVGILGALDAEVVKGLREGQTVLIGP